MNEETNGHRDAQVIFIDGAVYQRAYSAELKQCNNILHNHPSHGWGERGKMYWCLGVHNADR